MFFFFIFRTLGNLSSHVQKSKKVKRLFKELIAIKAGPGQFEQLKRDQRIKPLFQNSVRYMFLILNTSVILTSGLQQ